MFAQWKKKSKKKNVKGGKKKFGHNVRFFGCLDREKSQNGGKKVSSRLRKLLGGPENTVSDP